ncbi:hypothetical protein PZH42_28310, partial [Bacteroides cellulosilyticus]
NGDHDLPSYDSELSVNDNPVATTDSRFTGYRREKRTNFNGSLTLAYDIPGVKGLQAKAFYSYDYNKKRKDALRLRIEGYLFKK